MKDNNRRQSERQEIIWSIFRADQNNIKFIGHLLDISSNGIRFTSSCEFKKNEQFRIKITVPGNLYEVIQKINIEMDITIIWETEIPKKYHQYEVGAEFQNTEQLDSIVKFMEYFKTK